MTFRQIVFCFLIAVVAFIGFNFFVWKNFTEQLLTIKFGTGGDLSRLGYIVSAKQHRKASSELPIKHTEFRNYSTQRVDMIVIGDSFANGGGEGKNNFFQDYIATFNKKTVLNIRIIDSDKSPLDTAIILLNSGYIDKIKPKYILIESAERFSIERFAKDVNFDAFMAMKDIKPKISTNEFELFNYLPKMSFITDANLKYLYYKICYLFTDTPTRLVAIKKLDREMFNCQAPDKLLFVRDDIRSLEKSTPHNVKQMNDNLNHFAKTLGKRNIKLVFMPAVDKYNLYSDYIVNNPYPKSTFFEALEPLPKTYRYINTKQILSNALKNGEKDIFYPDDTHWSWKASELIFSKEKFD